MNLKPKIGILLTAFGLLLAAQAGCSGLEKPYTDKELYVLELTDATAKSTAPANLDKPVRINRVRVVQPYNTPLFVYKTSAGTITSDYYRGYAASPEQLLTGGLVDWFNSHGPAYAISAGSLADETFVLETQCTKLLGDYSNPQSPAATVHFRFQLLKSSAQAVVPVWAGSIEKTVPLKADTAQGLVDALSQAVREVYAELSAELTKAGVFNQAK
jgi:uncharacterized lipoprotein YmbA